MSSAPAMATVHPLLVLSRGKKRKRRDARRYCETPYIPSCPEQVLFSRKARLIQIRQRDRGISAGRAVQSHQRADLP